MPLPTGPPFCTPLIPPPSSNTPPAAAAATGKTTMTEKLLLYGGAIHEAGEVKARARSRSATSDWMELEKARGISISSTAMTWQYNGALGGCSRVQCVWLLFCNNMQQHGRPAAPGGGRGYPSAQQP